MSTSQAHEEIAVSVVIATRNRRPLLSDAIESVRAQAGVGWELIVVDDASEDDTWSFLSTQRGLQSFRQEVRGERSRARNVGLLQSRGQYVMFLDDDDVLRPGALAILSNALEQNGDAIAAVGARWDWFVDEGWGRRDTHPRISRKRSLYDEFLFGWSAISGQCLYRAEVVRQVGGYDETLTWCEDRDLWLRVACHGPIVLRSETVMTYRIPQVQDRPPDIRRIREVVARRSIRSLPQDARRGAIRIRRCSALVQQAEDRIRQRHPLESVALAARAAVACPRLLFSPLIGSWVAARLARGAAHSLRAR